MSCKHLKAALLLLLLALPARPEAPARLTEDIWESAYLDGARIGFLHTTVRPVGEADERLRATVQLDLSFRRHNAVLRLKTEHGTEETADGKVLGVFLRQQNQGKPLVVTGVVEGDRLHVRVDDGRIDRRIPWKADALGLYRLQSWFANKKPQAGDRLSFFRYEPVLTTMVTMRVSVGPSEEVAELGGQPRQKLLRVEMRMEPIQTPRMKVQLPAEVWWLDEHFVAVRRQMELEGLGTITLVRTSAAQAAAPVAAGLTDLGSKSLIPLNRAIPRAYFTRSARYRITVKGEENAASALVQDSHQQIDSTTGDTVELAVHPCQLRPKPEGKDTIEPNREYLGSSHFINADDARVRELAQQAVGSETDPWRKARRIERYVKQRMQPDNAAPLAPAGEVARTLRGDCRLYAFLTAALCRAEGIPARTAIGLIYVARGGRPSMGFHMWTEVCISGEWLGLDGTLGLGRVSAGHIKICDHSWHEVQSLTPLLPVYRVLGKMRIEVVRVE
jgi:transglutaminase-like putative cysteine protease